MLLVASVNKTREDEIDNDTVFIFVINLRNETECYRSKRERNCSFRENVNTCLQNKKTYLMVPLSHGHFHPILILHAKMVELPQQHANATVDCF